MCGPGAGSHRLPPENMSPQQATDAGSSEDGFIVEGRWLQPGQGSQGAQTYSHMPPLQEGFYVPEPPMPLGPKALPWLPSRTCEDKDFTMLTKEDFLAKLNDVCDSFQPETKEVENFDLQTPHRTFELAAAEGALSRLMEEVMWSGPIRHMAICVMAQRVIMLADSIKKNPDTPGGRALMAALLSSVKQMCAANTSDVTINKAEKFSGRVVLLLGSASCSPEVLIKTCCEKYRQIDHHCMITALSMGAEPAGSAQLGKAFAAAINAWADAEAQYGPPGTAGGAGRPELLVHLFGSAGFAAWSKMLRLWHEQFMYPDNKRD
ncbi:unnamed protein product [Effrenium voratum]|nr:unnamed protein product [Effrenium voratum]